MNGMTYPDGTTIRVGDRVILHGKLVAIEPGVDGPAKVTFVTGDSPDAAGDQGQEFRGLSARMFDPAPVADDEVTGPDRHIILDKTWRRDIDAILQRVKRDMEVGDQAEDQRRWSEERETAIEKLKEAAMWLGMDLKAINDENPQPPVSAVEKIARACHEANRAYCASIGDISQPAWDDAPEWQRQSAVKGVEFHLANPGAAASQSHEEWLKEKQATGWKFGPVKDAVKKEHPCFVPYEELPPEQRFKDTLFIRTVHTLAPILIPGDPYPNSRNPSNTKIDPTADGLKF